MNIAQHRLEALETVARFERENNSLRKACFLAGQSPATILRWRREFAAGGALALEPKTDNCGRKPLVTLNEEECKLAKKFYIQTGSKTSALRLLAHHDACRQEVADAILKRRRSKHTITRHLREQIELPHAVTMYHKSPESVRRNAFICPRTLSYIDALGAEKTLQPGDLFERDDMSNNFLCWVPWPWGGDPCSDKYGVRIARGQNLLMIDVASLYFVSFNFLIRLRDSYRADDIWQWVHQTYRDVGMPRIGERWERGTWASKKLRGDEEAVIEAGHTDEAARLGGMGALGLRVIESQSPTTKIIENRFNFFQTICATIPGLQIGRRRGEMERENKIWTACRLGHRDPREYCLSFEEVTDQIEAKIHYVNSEPVEGELYRGVPAEIWARGIAENPLRAIEPEQAYLFARDKHTITTSKGHVKVRFTDPDGARRAWWFYHENLYRHEGGRFAVYLDHYNAEAGATLVHAEGRDTGKVLGHAELIHGCPQFALGFQTGEETDAADRTLGALDRKRDFTDAVRSEYRSFHPSGRRLGRVAQVDDGRGRAASIASRGDHSPRLPAGGPGNPLFDGAGAKGRRAAAGDAGTISTRRHYDEDAELAHLAKLEARAREDGIILPV